jgi:hypothetical protein
MSAEKCLTGLQLAWPEQPRSRGCLNRTQLAAQADDGNRRPRRRRLLSVIRRGPVREDSAITAAPHPGTNSSCNQTRLVSMFWFPRAKVALLT